MSKALQKQLIASATGKHLEPKFEADQVLTQTQLASALNFYNANFDEKQKQKWALSWIQKNRPEALAQAKKAPVWSFGTFASLIRMEMRGLVLSADHKARVLAWVDSLGPRNEEEEAPKAPKRKKVSVNPNMQAFDDLLDEVLRDPKASQVFEVEPKADIKPVLDYCEQQLQLIKEDDKQYPKHMKKFFKGTIERLQGVVKAVKAKRVVTRKPRKVDPVKMAAKVKFKKEDPALQLKSIKPSDVVGKKKVYLFDTKYRRLTKLISSADAGFVFSGTSFGAVDPEKSKSKTVRKPEEVVKGKSGVRELDRAFNLITGKEFDVTSQRMNENIVIVAAS